MIRGEERRAHARVVVEAPLFLRTVTRSLALAGSALSGRLLDASRGGVAFACNQAVTAGDIVTVRVLDPRGEDCLGERYARVVDAAPDPRHGVTVRVAFAEVTDDRAWIERLGSEPPAVSRAED